MKITAEHIQEMHEAIYYRGMAVISRNRDNEIVVVPESTAGRNGWQIFTDASRFDEWTDGMVDPGDYQEYANAINADLDLED